QHPHFWALLTHVDRYIRFRRRKEFITAFANLPYRLDVYGNGWNNLKLDCPNVFFHPPQDFSGVQALMNNAKIAANVMPNFVEGGHERLFTSMLHGAAGLVDTNRF